jgi:hypothetical protein
MSPKILTYKGITLRFFSHEHLPPHVHAEYQDKFSIKVEFELKGEKIVKIQYKNVRGKLPFPVSQMHDLELLVERYKFDIVDDWIAFLFEMKE